MGTVKLRLKELMQTKKHEDGSPITQEDIALAINVPQSTLSRWVGNKVDRLDTGILAKLCGYFNCDIGDLLVFESDDKVLSP